MGPSPLNYTLIKSFCRRRNRYNEIMSFDIGRVRVLYSRRTQVGSNWCLCRGMLFISPTDSVFFHLYFILMHDMNVVSTKRTYLFLRCYWPCMIRRRFGQLRLRGSPSFRFSALNELRECETKRSRRTHCCSMCGASITFHILIGAWARVHLYLSLFWYAKW